MVITVKQVSSMEKVRKGCEYNEVHACSALAGERVAWQVAVSAEIFRFMKVEVVSPLKEHVRLFHVQDAVMDTPVTEAVSAEEDYLTLTPGCMPDILVPQEQGTNTLLACAGKPTVLWVRLDVPRDMAAGEYSVRLVFTLGENGTPNETVVESDMTVTVLPAVITDQRMKYTRWFYLDCIASAHNVSIFSEEHWALIEKYMAAAADLGITMLLVPTHTPPLDTREGIARPCVQLVDIEKQGDTYHFGFEKFRRYIALAQKHGIRYFETAHMFSQWGAKYAPNIMVRENGVESYQFGWHVAANDPRYIAFLKQYIAAIAAEVQALGIAGETYFHISDEPNMHLMETYKTAADMLHPLLGESKSMDALSDYAFYERGLVKCPVTSVTHIHDFLEHDVFEQWAYYCCGPQTVFPNSFMAMPSRRVRILGFLMYKYDIKGFLHWGFNFYHGCCSQYPLNPYLTTSADGAFPSGDPFIVYPAPDGVYASIRGEMTFAAMQDVAICRTLEARIGREAVVRMIDQAAGEELRFDKYPKTDEYILSLREAMLQKLAE